METILNLVYLLGGLVGLYFAGDFFVRGAAGLALKFKLSPLIVGLTVVAFGTSAPELFVSIVSSTKGVGAVAVGNVIGSNIANLLLIIGVAGLLMKLRSSSQLIKIELPIMFVSYAFLVLTIVDIRDGQVVLGIIEQWEGVLLFVGIIAYVVFEVVLAIHKKRKIALLSGSSHDSGKAIDGELDGELAEASHDPVWKIVLFLLVGIVGLALSSEILVTGAVYIAQDLLGISERVVGVTVVAIGTSLPELITSVVAARKGQSDMSIGNVLGSNIFNTLAVVGGAAMASPIPVTDGAFVFDGAIMVAATAILALFLLVRRSIHKVEAGILLTGYLAYLGFTVVQALG